MVGGLVGMGTPEDTARRYESRINEGGILVSVRCDSLERVNQAKDLLKTAGAFDVSTGKTGMPGAKPIRSSAQDGTLQNAKNLQGFTVRATDGEIGTVTQFYFDDETWAIRYLTVDTGTWLGGRLVLISPISVIGQPDWQSKRLDVSLTRTQVENSPYADTHQPVSRQHEIAYLTYYGYRNYWDGSDLWGSAPGPAGLAVGAAPVKGPKAGPSGKDSYLRSSQEVDGYSLEAPDGEIGHLDGFVFDDETWAIRYIAVATRNWWPGKTVLMSPAWIERISWAESKVHVEFSRETIKNAPEYVEDAPINREFENRLYSHYGRAPYWLHLAERRPPLSASGVGRR